LQELVGHGEIDAVLAIVTLDEIGQAWSRYTEQAHADEDDPDVWAILLIGESDFRADRTRWRAALLKLVEHAGSDDVLAVVGAGPLEEFVSDDEDDLRWLEEQGSTNPLLRKALAGVWCDNDLSSKTMKRLDAVAGRPLHRIPPREEWSAEALAVDEALNRARDAWAEGVDDPDTESTPDQVREHLDAMDELTRAIQARVAQPLDEDYQ
jgi:hypothetical protein